MDATLLHELDRIREDLRVLQTYVEILETRVETLLSWAQQEAAIGDHPTRLTDLRGLWKGADFDYETIKASEYTVSDELL
ncbi:MAG: hypothetical protein D6759_17945 [Chloroflexi bacterium]|nr:MAG: hypothetical protein D6759_17945 [Chloroflexota bacterium]